MSKYYKKVIKSAGDSFSVTAGVTTFMMGVLAAFFPIPAFVCLIVAAGVGLVAGFISGRSAYRAARHKDRHEYRLEQDSSRLVGMAKEVKQDVAEIKNTLQHRCDSKNDIPMVISANNERLTASPRRLSSVGSSIVVEVELSDFAGTPRSTNDRFFKSVKQEQAASEVCVVHAHRQSL